ncbi:MAG: RNA methyltransferase [Neisseriaceae bacterium]|nr:MAG: RNA methyltransferase [Neisseriaceae bacterium]
MNGIDIKTIVSKDNALVKRIARLNSDSKFRASQREAVVYGEHLIIEAMKYSLIEYLLLEESSLARYSHLVEKLSNEQIILVSAEVLNKINIFDSELSVVALIKQPVSRELDFSQQFDCVVLEHIQDPGNLGVILRAASAGGIKNIALSKNCVDVYNPKVLRASQGIQFALNIYSNCDLDEFVRCYSGQIYALTPHASVSIYEQDLTQNCALVLGNEGNGISDKLLSKIKQHITIPMPGKAESLNLAMAATVAIFELSRQRITNIRKK